MRPNHIKLRGIFIYGYISSRQLSPTKDLILSLNFQQALSFA